MISLCPLIVFRTKMYEFLKLFRFFSPKQFPAPCLAKRTQNSVPCVKPIVCQTFPFRPTRLNVRSEVVLFYLCISANDQKVK